MPILDQFGNSVTSSYKYAEGANRWTRERPFEPVRLANIQELIPAEDRHVLVSASRRLYANMPEIQGAMDQRAFYAVGRSYLPQSEATQDAEFAEEATRWLQDEWYNVADIVGSDFRTSLYNMALCIGRDGESGALFTEYEDGYPAIQIIPAHQIGQRDKDETTVQSGPYRGLRINDGVITNKVGRPVAYRILGETPEKDRDVSARDMLLKFEPQYPEQTRGLPAFSGALNMLRDSLTSHKWEQQALLMLSAFGIIEYNEDGGPDPTDPKTALAQGTTPSNGMSYETMAGGMVRYFRAGSGSKIETVDHDRPGDAWERFQDRILRKALAGINWPYSMVWKSENNGTVTREELMKAQKSIEDLQDTVESIALRCVRYAVAKAIKTGRLPASPEWYKWSFTKPAKLTIDDGRTGKTWVDMWRSGLVNMSEYLGAKGEKLESHLYQRAEEIAKRKLIAAEVSKKHKVEITDREMAMLTPNEPDATAQPTTANEP